TPSTASQHRYRFMVNPFARPGGPRPAVRRAPARPSPRRRPHQLYPVPPGRLKTRFGRPVKPVRPLAAAVDCRPVSSRQVLPRGGVVMKRFAVAGVLLAFGIGGLVLADEKALKEIAGTYKAVSVEKRGMPAPKEFTEKFSLTIKGDVMTVDLGDGQAKTAKIKVDAAKKPAQIDISPDDGAEKGRTFPGIYKLDKDELTLAFTEKADRPKEFASSDTTILLKLKKE